MPVHKKSHSIKRHFIFYFSLLMATTIMLLIFFSFYAMYTTMNQLRFSNATTLDLYVYEIETQLNDLVSFNQELYSNSYDFRMLAQKNTSETEALKSEFALRQSMKSRVTASSGILIFSADDSVFMYQFGSTLTATGDNIKMSRLVRDYIADADLSTYFSWNVLTDSNYSLLVNAYRLNDLFVCSIVNIDKLSIAQQTDDNALRFSLFDSQGFLTNAAGMAELNMELEDVSKTTIPSLFFPFQTMVQTKNVRNTDVSLCVVMPIWQLWTYSRWSVVIIIALFAAMCGLIYFVYTLVKKILIYPLNQISHTTENLALSSPQLPSLKPSRIEELQKINDALHSLLEQKETLERESYLQTYEKEHAMLQYYQLQTRSHFFINCLKSLYAMTETNDQTRMRRMILAFSNHLRYVFHDNLLLVSLQSELDEVLDYYNILLADRRTPVLLKQDVAPALLQCKVPPLVIQTFLENAYKYNDDPKKLLQFSIDIDQTLTDGQRHLRIRLCDNGVGFDEKTLQKLNTPEDDSFPTYHIGINNLKRRIRLIYRDQYQIAFFNQSGGGACIVIHLPVIEE